MARSCLAYPLVLLAASAALSQEAPGGPPLIGNARHIRHAWIVLGRSPNLGGGDPTEDLKAFNRAMAVQATSEQVTAYDSMVNGTETAISYLQGLQEELRRKSPVPQLSNSAQVLGQAVEKARSENQRFLDSFSKAQRAGLKEPTLRLAKADSDLTQQANLLITKAGDTNLDLPQIESYAKSLERALTSLHEQQFSLGNEMGIEDISGGKEIRIDLQPVKSLINIEKQPVAITVGGTISRGAAEAGQDQFKLKLTADLSDLQHSLTEILRSKLDKSDRCGERVAIQSVALTAEAPASLAVTQLHWERWACFMSSSQGSPQELAESNGTIEMKLTPVVGQDHALRLVPEVGRVDAIGMLGEQLRSGPLGTALRDAITQSLLSAVRIETDFKATLPPVAQNASTIEKVEFREAGGLHVVLDGKVQIREEEVQLLADQLRDRL